MCDYSLHYVASRPAKIEDKLIVTTFENSITRGFAAVGEPTVAVCLLPGTEIAFEENVKYEPPFGIGILPNKKIPQRLARFRQINMDNAVTHHVRSNSLAGRLCCSLGSMKVNKQRCCSCRPHRMA